MTLDRENRRLSVLANAISGEFYATDGRELTIGSDGIPRFALSPAEALRAFSIAKAALFALNALDRAEPQESAPDTETRE